MCQMIENNACEGYSSAASTVKAGAAHMDQKILATTHYIRSCGRQQTAEVSHRWSVWDCSKVKRRTWHSSGYVFCLSLNKYTYINNILVFRLIHLDWQLSIRSFHPIFFPIFNRYSFFFFKDCWNLNRLWKDTVVSRFVIFNKNFDGGNLKASFKHICQRHTLIKTCPNTELSVIIAPSLIKPMHEHRLDPSPKFQSLNITIRCTVALTAGNYSYKETGKWGCHDNWYKHRETLQMFPTLTLAVVESLLRND